MHHKSVGLRVSPRPAARLFTWVSSLFLTAAALSVPLQAQSIVHQINLASNESWCSDSAINTLFQQINAVRASKGIAALAMDGVGMKVAELRAVQFANYMFTHSQSEPGFNPHTGYDTTAAQNGYNIISENLAFQASDPMAVVYNIWSGDSLHLGAMLAQQANVAGVSCIVHNGVTFWTYDPGYKSGVPSQPVPAPPPTTTPTPNPAIPSPGLDAEESAFLTLINNFRTQNGVGTLQVSSTLQNAAEWKSNDMAVNNLTDHIDSLGRSPQQRMAAFGYTYTPNGENILGGYNTAQQAFDGWANACDAGGNGVCTYAHRANMLGAAYKAIGIGRVSNPNSMYGVYWTTDFGAVVDAPVTPPTPTPTPSAPVISSFTANPASITSGQSSTLGWSVTGATSLTIDNGVGSVTSKTSQAVAPTATTTYTLTATNASGSVTKSVTVTVSSSTPAPTPNPQPGLGVPLISTLSANPSTVVAGQIVTVGWSVAGATSLSLTGLGNVTGTTLVTFVPTQSGTYTLTATNSLGSATKSVSITVNPTAPAPPPTNPNLDTKLPTAPVVSGAAVGTTRVNLQWTPSTDNVGVIRYVLIRNNSIIAELPFGSLSYYDMSVTANVTYTYLMVSYDYSGNASPASAPLIITPGATTPPTAAPVINSFNASPDSMTSGQSSTLTWSVTGATSLTISNGGGDVTGKTSLVVSPSTTTTYTLTATGTGGTVTKSVTLTVTAPTPPPTPAAPVINSFTASPASITSGQSSTLSWSVTGATSLAISNGGGDVTNKASLAVSPSATNTYILTATNSGGSVTRTVTVTVTTPAPPPTPTAPVINSFTASPASITSGQSSTLTWSVSGASTLTINNGGGDVTNKTSLAVSPTATIAYTLSASNAGGTTTKTVTVTVTTPTPTPTPGSGSCPSIGTNNFTGCYFSNQTFSGDPVLVRTDPALQFNWGLGAPLLSMSSKNYSIRWQGNFTFLAGNYQFSEMIGGAARVSIDGVPILDFWQDLDIRYYDVTKAMTAGTHLVTVEYMETNGYGAMALSWLKRP